MAAPSTSTITSALLFPNYWWGGAVITYSIPTASSQWSGYASGQEPSNASYSVLSSAQAQRFAAAANAWDRVLNITLTQTNDLNQPGQIRVAFTDVDDFDASGSWGYATSPPYRGGGATPQNGDIWIDDSETGAAFADGSYDFMALMHEFGHALGLKHSFEDGAVLPAEFDNHRYTLMSYSEYRDDQYLTIQATATGITTRPVAILPSTPMVFDILALQSRYGADTATGAGATTYSWSQAAPFMQTVYDSGGIDVIDLSAHTRGSIVDLTPGAYSSIAYYSPAAQAAYWTTLYAWAGSFISQQFNQPTTYTWSNNLGIAYGTVIENVVGSAGADTLGGNDAANNLAGNGGADSLTGQNGDDYLRGGDGNDTFGGGAGFDDINGNTGDDSAAGGLGNDWVVGGQNNDVLLGEDGDDIVYGNLGNDTGDGGAGNDLIRGGQGDDSLAGGAGADWLSGDRGNDTVSGGAGADVFHSFSGAGLDRVLDFRLSEGDRVLLDAGTTYTLRQSGADTVIDLGLGDSVVLVGVTLSALTGNWIGY